MKTLNVELGERRYPIHIGSGLLRRAELLQPCIAGSRVAVVTNETVGPLYLDTLLKQLTPWDPVCVVLPDGEVYKTLDVLNNIFTALLKNRCDRKTTLIALGGGVVGDMTGFAAATYQRGVPFIQVPTTLLAQVDSSVGGKTGVNHPLGKNMIGAFHQPECVIIDTDTLSTLPDKELSAGLAEVIKYGLIGDAEFFVWLEQNMDKLMQRDPQTLVYAIERSCADKARVVAADEREAGSRALLESWPHLRARYRNRRRVRRLAARRSSRGRHVYGGGSVTPARLAHAGGIRAHRKTHTARTAADACTEDTLRRATARVHERGQESRGR